MSQEGIGRQIRIARQAARAAYADKSGQSRYLPRNTFGFNFSKDLLTNNEKRPSRMEAPDRHGLRRVDGNNELNLAARKAWQIFQAVLRRRFRGATVLTSTVGNEYTFAAAGKTITQVAGDFTTNLSAGDKFRLDGDGLTVSNHGEYTVDTVVALVITVEETLLDDASVVGAEIYPSGVTDPVKSTSAAGDGFTVDATNRTITRGAGGGESFIADGHKVGRCVRLRGMTETANHGINFVLTDVTDTILTYQTTDTVVDDAAANDGGAEVVVPGSTAYYPPTDHKTEYFTVESYDPDMDVPTSKCARDVQIDGFEDTLSPTDVYTTTFEVDGEFWNVFDSTTTPVGGPYFDAVLDAYDSEPFGGIDLSIIADDELIDCEVVDLTFTATNNQQTTDTFCGARVNKGKVSVSGQMTLLLKSRRFLDAFDQETFVPLTFLYQSLDRSPVVGDGNAREILTRHVPYCKINSHSEDDPDGPLLVTVDFKSYERDIPDPATSKWLPTTLDIQDSMI